MKTKTKLTLRMDEDLVKRAKRVARKRGTSVSKMVANYFALLDRGPDSEPRPEDLPPLTRSLWGAAEGAKVDEQDYLRYLEEKHR
jgi:hypothetical protein